MKKLLSFLLAALMLCEVSASLAGEAAAGREPRFSTMAEAIAYDEDAFSGWYNGSYAAVLHDGERYLRVVAAVDEAAAERYNAIESSIDYRDLDDYWRVEAEMNELGRSLPVAYTEDITGAIIAQETLDAAVGRTLGELKDEGYFIEAHEWNEITGEAVFTVCNGLFRYDFAVNEPAGTYLRLCESGDEDAFDSLTVRSACLDGFSGNVLDLRYHADGTHDPIEDPLDFSGFDLMDLLNQVMSDSVGMDHDSLSGGSAEGLPGNSGQERVSR